jgi:death-on-curing protein
MRWIDPRSLILLHGETLAEHGGLSGWRDENAFDSALARPQNLRAYKPKTDLAGIAAAYGFGIVRNHPFNDGNKRIGFLAVGLFLSLNGYDLVADQLGAFRQIDQLAAGKLTERALAEWIRKHMVRSR